MNFFDPPADAPFPAERPPRPVWMMPEDVLPATVPGELVLAHTERAAIAVTALRAYPDGFAFTLLTVLRQEDHDGHVFVRPRRIRPDRPGPLPDEFIRVGVQFADGTSATNLRWPPFEGEPPARVLTMGSGSSDNRRSESVYWVWPAPPPGPLVFVCQWPKLDIPESRAELDATLIIDASARALVFWP